MDDGFRDYHPLGDMVRRLFSIRDGPFRREIGKGNTGMSSARV